MDGLAADPRFDDRLAALITRITQLKRRFEQHPEHKIPELVFLTTAEWIGAAQEFTRLESDADFARALSSVRTTAKWRFGDKLHEAVKAFAAANAGQLPVEVAQLAPYFESPVDPALFLRYEMRATGRIEDLRDPHDYILREKESAVFDPSQDNVISVTTSGVASGMVERPPQATINGQPGDLKQLPVEAQKLLEDFKKAAIAYTKDHNGRMPTSGEQLRPYLTDANSGALTLSEITMTYTFPDSLYILDPTAFSDPDAMNQAKRLFRAVHHGEHPTSPEQLAPYFQDPTDAAKYILAARELRQSSPTATPAP